jgi:spore coat polysaccharide biosynthesis protein SpsF (cytidylyltransferase family)
LKIPKELRLTIDYPEDFEFANKLYQKLNVDFTYLDILNIVNKNKEILKIIENIQETWSKNYENELDKKHFMQTSKIIE